jgi:predicted phage terminase large subunit-like protein
LLWAERFGPVEIESLKVSLGSYAAAGQLQQRPSPSGGGLIKRHWFRYWQPRGANLPPVSVRLPDGTVTFITAVEVHRVDEQIQSWDCAFKDLNTSDYVVGQVWARLGAAFFLGDQVRGRMDCPTTVKAVRELSEKWPSTLAKLIEDKANGSAVIQMLARDIVGLLPVNPQGGKVARAAAVSPLIEAGNVYLPHPLYAPWVNDFIEECAAFPNGAHDDQVDAMTQALLRWHMVPQQTVVYEYVPYQISPI